MQLPGETLLTRLWDTVADKGIGGLLKPWQIRRVGLAQVEVKRQELLMLAQAEADVTEIRARRSRFHPSSGLRLSSDSIEAERAESTNNQTISLADAAAENALQDQLRKDVNITRTLGFSEKILEGDTSLPPEDKPSDEWLYRWRDYASDVSSEELQVLWARLLADEIRAPGSFSMRTLDFVRNLSSHEAKLASRLLSLTVLNWIFIGLDRDKKLSPYGISFQELLDAQSLGIVASVDGFGLTFNITAEQNSETIATITYGDRVLIVTKTEGEKKVDIPVFTVTPLGLQVRALAPQSYNYDYFKDIGKHIAKTGATVKIGQFVSVSATEIRIYNATEIEG